MSRRPFPIASVFGRADGSGLRVEVPVAVLADIEDLDGSIQLLSEIAGMPITIEPGEVPAPTSRQDDNSPWWGGALYRHPGFNPPNDYDPYRFCSTSFALNIGQGRLLSAAHCDAQLGSDSVINDRDGNTAWNDGAGEPFTSGGDAVDIRARNDTLLINPFGGASGWVYGGPYNALSGHGRYALKVGGAARASFEERVCASGANSGEHCGLIVRDRTIRQFTCGEATCNGFTARDNDSSTASTVGGDSGGPVSSNRPDGRVGARGTVYGGTVDANCGLTRFDVSNCYSTLFFVDIEALENQWDATVKTTQ